MEKINLANMLEVLEKQFETLDKHHLSSFLGQCCIVKINKDKIIVGCNYCYHKNVLERDYNKPILEDGFSKILKTKISLEFILFDEAVKSGYQLALKEKERRDAEWKKKEEKEKMELETRRKEQLKERVKERIENRIPSKFKNAELKKCLKIVQDYYSQKKHKEKGFFLFGGFGTGKTYNVYALAKQLITDDINVWVFNLPRLLNTIRSSFSKQEVYNEDTDNYSYAFVKDMKDIEGLINVDILIIDDIGAEKPSDWVAETLYYLINSRYEDMRTTIFTSNLSLDKLADRIGDRIVSRIAEMCDVYEISGEDKRLKTENQ